MRSACWRGCYVCCCIRCADLRLKGQKRIPALAEPGRVVGGRELSGERAGREGEAGLLAGGTEQTECNNGGGSPGIRSVGLAALGGSVNRNKQQNEILITVTPHAIRMPEHPEVAFPVE